MNLTTEQIQEILDNAPDDTWSYYSEPSYLRETESGWDYHCPEYGWMDETELHEFDDLHSRKDLETIITQHAEIERLKTGHTESAANAIELFIANQLRSACLSAGWDTESSAYQVILILEEYAYQLREQGNE